MNAHRVFIGRTKPPELAVAVQDQGPATRVTLRAESPIRIEMRRERNQVALFIDRTVDPVREQIEFRGRLIGAIAFDDADGKAKIVVETTDAVGDVRIAAAEENRVYTIDFTRPDEIAAIPAPSPPPTSPLSPLGAPASVPNPGLGPLEARQPAAPLLKRLIKTIVVDPGHGGIDAGAANGEAVEKNLTLAIARRMRTALESRLGATVVLTRDSDVDLSSEARAVLANNNQANLLISVHIGLSTNKQDFGGIYAMKEGFGAEAGSAGSAEGNRLFVPWYLGYRASLPASNSAARLLRDELELAIPAWRFPVRQAPLAVLASSAAPSIMLEIGNLSDPVNAQTLLDPAFQTRVAAAAAAAVERYAALRETGTF
jgi:N-acetylmuramoyl-L-alanine amidase